MGLGGSLAAIEFAFADFLGKGFVVEAPGHELAFGVEVGDLAAEEAAGPEEGDVRLAPGESAVPVALMQVAHGSDVPLAARRQHRAAGAAVGAGDGGGLGQQSGEQHLGHLGQQSHHHQAQHLGQVAFGRCILPLVTLGGV